MVGENQMNRLLYYLRYDWPLHFIMVLTSWLPNNVVFFRLRGFLCRPFFGSCGSHLSLGRNITFYNASLIHFGENVYAAVGCVFLALADVIVENEVLFGPYVVISSANHTKFHGSYRFGPTENTPIRIGSGSWIGAHSTVLAGAIIGKGCVIGSNAAVTRGTIPDDCFAAGVPARVIQKDAVII